MYVRAAVLACVVFVAAGACNSDPGIIDCQAYVNRQIECEVLPPGNSDINIKICNNWEKTYKQEVMQALSDCIDVPCEEAQICAQQANQLCQADVTSSIEGLCERVVECQWEELTTMELCRDELGANQGLYMCLRPDVLEDYVACVRDITCGPDSEDEWYGCGFKHVGPG